MPKNKLSDLNNHLFEQLERLNDDNLKGDELKGEVDRAKAMAQIATQIVNGQKMVVDAMKLVVSGKVDNAAVENIIGKNQLGN